MSLNKVLNRPMFRKEALRKGHLKPIKANVGQFIGPNRPGVPMVVNRPGMGVPVGQPRVPAGVPAVRPGMFSRFMRGIGTGPFMFGYDTTLGTLNRLDPNNEQMSTLGKNVLAAGGGFGLNALALRTMPALLAPGIIPAGVGMAAGAGVMGLADLVNRGIKLRKEINAMTPEQREAFSQEQRAKAFDYGITDADLFGKIRPDQLNATLQKDKKVKDPTGITESSKKLEQMYSGKDARPFQKFDQAEADVALQADNTTQLGNEKVIDTSKIAENAIPDLEQFNRQDSLPPKTQVVDDTQDSDDKKGKDKVQGGAEDANKDEVDSNSLFKQQLDEAQKMVEDLRRGKGSNANLVFLSNLASGLMSGTTMRGGLAGAVEVLGKALGPAVNNMVMVRMKEDEIKNNLMGRVLDFKANFLKAQNEAFEMPDTENVGVIQYTNNAGRIVNVPGRILKDGTKQRATGRTINGVSEYETVDPSLNFIKLDDANKETLELAESIAGKYAAVNLINRSLGIIEKGDAQAGVTGAIGLYGGRVSEALGDVFSFLSLDGDNKSALRTAGKSAFEIEKQKVAQALVAANEFEDKKSALAYLDKSVGTFEKNRRSALNSAKRRLKDGNALDYERLAINETVLVYKLANSLKAKDRLTQKDIEMAKGLVKVFPLLRGETNVIASLTATAETILDDIKQQERLYERAGGSSEYLLNERKAYGLLPNNMTIDTMTDFESPRFRELQKNIGEMTEEDFKRIFPNL